VKYGVLADIHSNEEALRAVLTLLREQGVKGFLVVGDIVGYGPNPDETVAAVRALPHGRAVAGNHDRAVVGKKDLDGFNPHARAAALWTARQLTPASKKFLSSLPDRVATDRFTLVHGTPQNPIDDYFTTSDQFRANEGLFETPVCFVGHTHVPRVLRRHGDGAKVSAWNNGETIKTPPRDKTVLNPGSVGQPRDGDPRAACGVYDDETGEATLFRVAYDVAAVQKKMRDARLPAFLADRLAEGR